MNPAKVDDAYFYKNEKLRSRFNTNEIDGFMRLLNVKPLKQWEDDSGYHWHMGSKTYEDDAQEMDPYFHILAEVERSYVDKNITRDFRRGAEIKFELNEKKPRHIRHRF